MSYLLRTPFAPPLHRSIFRLRRREKKLNNTQCKRRRADVACGRFPSQTKYQFGMLHSALFANCRFSKEQRMPFEIEKFGTGRLGFFGPCPNSIPPNVSGGGRFCLKVRGSFQNFLKSVRNCMKDNYKSVG